MTEKGGSGGAATCLICPRLEERMKMLKESDDLQWKQINELATAINHGKNWIIAILVTLIMTLTASLISAGILIARSI